MATLLTPVTRKRISILAWTHILKRLQDLPTIIGRFSAEHGTIRVERKSKGRPLPNAFAYQACVPVEVARGIPRRSSYFIAAAVIVTLLGCNGSAAPVVPPHLTRLDTARLRTVPVLDVDMELNIGAADVVFADVQDVAVDRLSRVYVLEGRTNIIHQFNSKGEKVREFGGTGSGPGELDNPRSITIGGDTVFVLDTGIEMYDTTGAYLGRVPDETRRLIRSYLIRHTTEGVFSAQRVFGHMGNGGKFLDSVRVAVTDLGSGKTTDVMALAGNTRYKVGPGIFNRAMSRPPSTAFGVDGRVYHTVGDSFHIEVWRSRSRSSYGVIAVLPRIPTTRDDFNSEYAAVAEFFSENGVADEAFRRIFRNVPRSRYRPMIADLIASDHGVVAVQRFDQFDDPYSKKYPNETGPWLLLDSAFEPVGRVLLPLRFQPRVFVECDILGILHGDADVKSVARYEIHEHPDAAVLDNRAISPADRPQAACSWN